MRAHGMRVDEEQLDLSARLLLVEIRKGKKKALFSWFDHEFPERLLLALFCWLTCSCGKNAILLRSFFSWRSDHFFGILLAWWD